MLGLGYYVHIMIKVIITVIVLSVGEVDKIGW